MIVNDILRSMICAEVTIKAETKDNIMANRLPLKVEICNMHKPLTDPASSSCAETFQMYIGIFRAFCNLHARRSGILHRAWDKTPSSVLWKNYATCSYKAVIFDMGGVLLPSPYKLATGEPFYEMCSHLVETISCPEWSTGMWIPCKFCVLLNCSSEVSICLGWMPQK